MDEDNTTKMSALISVLCWFVVEFKADCLTRDLGLQGECPPRGLSNTLSVSGIKRRCAT